MEFYEINFETPRGHAMHVLIAAPDVTTAYKQVHNMLREFAEEAILSGRTGDFDDWEASAATVSLTVREGTICPDH